MNTYKIALILILMTTIIFIETIALIVMTHKNTEKVDNDIPYEHDKETLEKLKSGEWTEAYGMIFKQDLSGLESIELKVVGEDGNVLFDSTLEDKDELFNREYKKRAIEMGITTEKDD